MSGQNENTNTTIAYPGPNWHMIFDNGALGNFQLDIVGFLAVLGEGSVTANAQVSALSTLFYLPRLMPAPQALLWPSRPVELPPTKATVTGVPSGMVKEHVHHVANVLLGPEMKKHMVRCVRVTKTEKRHRHQTWKDRFFRGEPARPTEHDMKGHDLHDITHLKKTPSIDPAVVKAKANGPLAWVTLASFGLSLIMFTASFLYGDFMSLVSTVLLSSLSTLIGVVNKCSLCLPSRPRGANTAPPVQVVVRYPNGSFLVVKCDENVARELYFAPEEIQYKLKSAAAYRLVSLVGTVLLMVGVVCLANAKLQLQFAWGGAYVITNILHWVAAAVPARMHWDLSCYSVKEESVTGGPMSETYTEALWKAIVFMKSTEWIKNGNAAPRTRIWDAWLDYVEAAALDVKSHEGPLIEPNPNWLDGQSRIGRTWDVPREFDAKMEYDRIANEFQIEAFSSRSVTPLPDAKH